MFNDDQARAGAYSATEISNRQVTELIGIARGLIADAELNDAEIEFLYRWLAASEGAHANPMIALLMERIRDIFTDGYVDEDERADLTDVLMRLTSNDFELGEALKATELPLTEPAPNIQFDSMTFCLTGTFSYGKRGACESLIERLGGRCAKNLTQSTNYLVIGSYATDSWKQSSFGRKIEQATKWQAEGLPIAIVSERHWRDFF